MDDNTMIVPKDFVGKIIEKSWFNKDVVIIIYFDENKWHPTEIENWADLIHKFTDCQVMLLPKSFSSLKYLTYDQMLLLKNVVDRAVNEMSYNKNN